MPYELTLLQPLRIPSGWMVAYNEFREIDPETVAEDDFLYYFCEDLLLLERVQGSNPVVIDLGWFPEGDSTGTFRTVVVRYFEDIARVTNSWDTPLDEFRSSSRQAVVRQIEE